MRVSYVVIALAVLAVVLPAAFAGDIDTIPSFVEANSGADPVANADAVRRERAQSIIARAAEFLQAANTPLDNVMKRVEENLDAIKIEEDEIARERLQHLTRCRSGKRGQACRALVRKFKDCPPSRAGADCREDIRKSIKDLKNKELLVCRKGRRGASCRKLVKLHNLCGSDKEAEACRKIYREKLRAVHRANEKCPPGEAGYECRKAYRDLRAKCPRTKAGKACRAPYHAKITKINDDYTLLLVECARGSKGKECRKQKEAHSKCPSGKAGTDCRAKALAGIQKYLNVIKMTSCRKGFAGKECRKLRKEISKCAKATNPEACRANARAALAAYKAAKAADKCPKYGKTAHRCTRYRKQYREKAALCLTGDIAACKVKARARFAKFLAEAALECPSGKIGRACRRSLRKYERCVQGAEGDACRAENAKQIASIKKAVERKQVAEYRRHMGCQTGRRGIRCRQLRREMYDECPVRAPGAKCRAAYRVRIASEMRLAKLLTCKGKSSGACRTLRHRYYKCEKGNAGKACRKTNRVLLSKLRRDQNIRQCPSGRAGAVCRRAVRDLDECEKGTEGAQCRKDARAEIRADRKLRNDLRCPASTSGRKCRELRAKYRACAKEDEGKTCRSNALAAIVDEKKMLRKNHCKKGKDGEECRQLRRDIEACNTQPAEIAQDCTEKAKASLAKHKKYQLLFKCKVGSEGKACRRLTEQFKDCKNEDEDAEECRNEVANKLAAYHARQLYNKYMTKIGRTCRKLTAAFAKCPAEAAGNACREEVADKMRAHAREHKERKVRRARRARIDSLYRHITRCPADAEGDKCREVRAALAKCADGEEGDKCRKPLREKLAFLRSEQRLLKCPDESVGDDCRIAVAEYLKCADEDMKCKAAAKPKIVKEKQLLRDLSCPRGFEGKECRAVLQSYYSCAPTNASCIAGTRANLTLFQKEFRLTRCAHGLKGLKCRQITQAIQSCPYGAVGDACRLRGKAQLRSLKRKDLRRCRGSKLGRRCRAIVRSIRACPRGEGIAANATEACAAPLYERLSRHKERLATKISSALVDSTLCLHQKPCAPGPSGSDCRALRRALRTCPSTADGEKCRNDARAVYRQAREERRVTRCPKGIIGNRCRYWREQYYACEIGPNGDKCRQQLFGTLNAIQRELFASDCGNGANEWDTQCKAYANNYFACDVTANGDSCRNNNAYYITAYKTFSNTVNCTVANPTQDMCNRWADYFRSYYRSYPFTHYGYYYLNHPLHYSNRVAADRPLLECPSEYADDSDLAKQCRTAVQNYFQCRTVHQITDPHHGCYVNQRNALASIQDQLARQCPAGVRGDECRSHLVEYDSCGANVECKEVARSRLDKSRAFVNTYNEKCVMFCPNGAEGDSCRKVQAALARCEIGEAGLACRVRNQNKLRKMRSKFRYNAVKSVKQAKQAVKENPERRVPVALIELSSEPSAEEEPMALAEAEAEAEAESEVSEPAAEQEAEADSEAPLIMLESTEAEAAPEEALAAEANPEAEYFQELNELTSAATANVGALESSVNDMEQVVEY